MNRFLFHIVFSLILFLFTKICAQRTILDDFEKIDEWNVFVSDGVRAIKESAEGKEGRCIRFNFDFTKGSGYGGIQKVFPLELPDNFKFTFYLRGNSPNNNFEIKFLDSSGENVWWMNNRNYEFPKEWNKFTVKKRHINFAWGPIEDKSLKVIDKIEFTIASFSGGEGWIEIDYLELEPLPPEDMQPAEIILSASSELGNDYSIGNILDNDPETIWLSAENKEAEVYIDFQQSRELGGFIIDWAENHYPENYEISLSDDGIERELVYSVSLNNGGRNYIRLVNAEAKYAVLTMKQKDKMNSGISEFKILNPAYSENLNRFFINMAKDFPRGFFPRYFYEEKSYWNLVGVNADEKEALINEDGMIEPEKAGFSIEPMLFLNGKIITWNDVKTSQSLQDEYLPIPIVTWETDDLNLEIKSFAAGKANLSSVLYGIYTVYNGKNISTAGKLFLLIRPFQVNPYYQWLNLEGGVSKIGSINISDDIIVINDENFIYPLSEYDDAGAMKFEEGNIVSLLSENNIPRNKIISDKLGLASGVLSFDINLLPGETKTIMLAMPFYQNNTGNINFSDETTDRQLVFDLLDKNKKEWNERVSHVTFDLPESADQIVNTYRSNLAYILINRDNSGIQPGSRSYERSWIRDGSLTSSALLGSGIKDEVREFIDWYSLYQYENGKIPCVVDRRGPDPVPENDSHGEYIFLLKQYFNFVRDTSFLAKHNPKIIKAVDYIKYLIDQRSTDDYKYGNDSIRAYYGIMPESISHEGYSAKPMHSYWDNFMTLRGLKDAVDIQNILGNYEEYERIKEIRDKFETDLYNSLRLAVKENNIDYIPGCVELGDFDATSTTVALYPAKEINDLPQPYLNNTFDKYYEFFISRSGNKINWKNYTPYEVRIIGSFIYLDQKNRAHELLEYFMKDRRPQGWNLWAEVVWRDERFPGFIGDMPHTWVGSDFINAVRTMFAYENEIDTSLVICAGLYDDWIDDPDGMSVKNLPTFYGELSYDIKTEDSSYFIRLTGDLILPPGKIILKNFNASRLPRRVFINDAESQLFTNNSIIIDKFPAVVKIFY